LEDVGWKSKVFDILSTSVLCYCCAAVTHILFPSFYSYSLIAEDLTYIMAKELSEHSHYTGIDDIFIKPSGELQYYISLLHLLSACCRGKATVEEVRCKSLFLFNELCEVIINKKTLFVVKLPIIMVMYDAYLDSDLSGEGVEEMQLHMPTLLNELLYILKGGHILQFLNCGLTENNVSIRYCIIYFHSVV